MNLHTWGYWTTIVAATGQALFTLFYLTFPWYKTFLGRALFFKAAMFTLLLGGVAIGMVYDWPNEPVWITVFYTLTAIGIWAQFAAFIAERLGLFDQDSTQEKRDYHNGT
jgi:hypothetical protein